MAVYFAAISGDRRYVKIGYTTDIDTRLSGMNVYSPVGIEILATIPGGRETEQYLHEIKFPHLRHRGEWFRYEGELIEFVANAKAGKAFNLPVHEVQPIGRMSSTDYSELAIAQAKIMANELLETTYRGVGDTIQSAMARCQAKTGFPATWLHRLRYRDTLNDIPAGVYLHLASIWGDEMADIVAGKESEAAE